MENSYKNNFLLPSDWFLQRPIDAEHKFYILNSFLQKVEEALSRGEVYPYFTEISLHMASIASYLKKKKYIVIEKEINNLDEEILLWELKEKSCRKKFTDEENLEIKKILKDSHEKLVQYFSVCKGIWDMTFESTYIKVRKNRKMLGSDLSYVVYQDKYNEEIYVWECSYDKATPERGDSKIRFELIYQGNDKKFTEVIKTFSTTKSLEIPIFEVFSTQNFPIENTLLPLFKRKIHNYIIQSRK
jgi:hypothetical protein